MNLTVGVTEWRPQWQLILGQIGAPVAVVGGEREVTLDQYGVIIVTARSTRQDKDMLLRYLARGGGILVEAHVAEWLLGTGSVPAYVKYVDPEGDPLFHGILPGFIHASLLLPTGAENLESDSGKKLTRVMRHGEGFVLILPGTFSECVLDTKVMRRNFPTPGPLLPSERVARRSKQTVRAIIERSLEYLYFERKLPFVSLWPFPEGHPTIFGFRVDTDFASEEHSDKLYNLCHDHKIPGSWFVETASPGDGIRRYAKMENQEIGLHCFRHRVFSSFIRNELDVKKGLRILAREQIRPLGYAAPFGLWNVSLAKAVEHHGFTYSSEFTLHYDDLPFYPHLGDRFSRVLQVPVHPITTGHLRNAHHSPGDMELYFTDLVQDHMEHRLPILVYDHPSNAHLQVLNWLVNAVRERGIPTVPLIDYAQWWKRRNALNWTARFDGDSLMIDGMQPESSVWISVRKSVTEWTVEAMKEVMDLQALKWRKNEPEVNVRTSMSRRSLLNRKMIMNDILHYYWRFKL
ncbi:MAG: hypothetical protein ACE5GH_00540 [Fidelibacterota bacterium]